MDEHRTSESSIDSAEKVFFEKLQPLIAPHFRKLSKRFSRICAVDAAYSKEDKTVCSVAVLYENGKFVEGKEYFGKYTFPYVSGLFFLHEGPFAVAAVERLDRLPDLVCFDAHGLAHPRSSGLAKICGMILGIPSLGLGKSRLVGQVVSHKGGISRIVVNNKTAGFVTHSQKDLFWSPGYSLSLSELAKIIQQHGEVCTNAMQRAHEISKATLNKTLEKKHLFNKYYSD